MQQQQQRRRRLGFLPDWRLFTYVIVGFNLLMVVWMVGGAVSGAHQAVSDCAKQADLSFETCKAASNTGTGIVISRQKHEALILQSPFHRR